MNATRSGWSTAETSAMSLASLVIAGTRGVPWNHVKVLASFCALYALSRSNAPDESAGTALTAHSGIQIPHSDEPQELHGGWHARGNDPGLRIVKLASMRKH